MSNDSNYDVAVEQNMGLLNATISGDDIWLLDTVKVCIHGAIFLTTFFLTYLIVVTVCHTAELRRNVRFILLCHHCACVTSFNAVGTVLHGLRALRLPISRLTCWLLFDFQVALGRGMGITLTLMAINTCLSILRPLHYPKLVRRIRASVIALAWFVALLNPVLFTVLACAQSSWAYVVELDPVCSTTLESPASRFSSLALVAFLLLLIMTSYVLIYMEGCRAGHFSRSNSYGRRTILIHMLQMILYLLPLVPIIARLKHNMAATVTNYVVFLVGQGLSPVVYGLRSRELRKQLPRFLPRWTTVFQTSSGHSGVTDCSSTGTAMISRTTTSTETVTSAESALSIGTCATLETEASIESASSEGPGINLESPANTETTVCTWTSIETEASDVTETSGLTETSIGTEASDVTETSGLTETSIGTEASDVTETSGLTETSIGTEASDVTETSGLTETSIGTEASDVTETSGLTETSIGTEASDVTEISGLTETSIGTEASDVTETRDK